jgi:glutamate racemase
MDAIGVFDSGVGGLTVLSALRKRWPGENFIYLADTARLPYGSKSLHTIRSYVEQNIRFLRQYPLKAIVIACNSASTAILDQPLKSDIPILNVVEPGARKALELSPTKRIGILGTRATIMSEAYPRALRQLDSTVEAFQQACPLFVPLVEEGWIDDPVTNLIVYRHVSVLLPLRIDTLILGCTHYPALRKSIERAAGPETQLVDSSSGLIEDLHNLGLNDTGHGQTKILCTDFSPRLEQTIQLLLDGMTYDTLELVDLI